MKKYYLLLILLAGIRCMSSETITVPYGKSRIVEIKGSSAAKYLSFDARIDTAGKYSGGGAAGLEVRFNGYALQPDDLANKKNRFYYGRNPLEYISGSGKLFLPYAAWSEKGVPQRIIQRYTFRIDSIARQNNTLEFINTYRAVKDSSVQIRNLVLHDSPETGGRYINNSADIIRLAPAVNIPLGKSSTLKIHGNTHRYLAFSGKITTGKWKSGAQPALIISVNGMDLRKRHLVNKGDFFHFSSKHNIQWLQGKRLTLGYYDWNNVQRTLDKDFIHEFVFDLKDLLLPDQENHIVLHNIFAAFPGSSVDLRDVRLLKNRSFAVAKTVDEKTFFSDGAADLRRKAESLHPGVDKCFQIVSETEQCQQAIDFQYRTPVVGEYSIIDNDGRTAVTFNSSIWQTESFYKVKNKLYRLQRDNTLNTGIFTVQRTVKTTEYGIEISETMSNLSDSDLPVVYVHAFKLPLEKIKEFRVAGEAMRNFVLSTDNFSERKYSQTPLFYLGMEQCGMGIYLMDDVFRNHYSAMAVDKTLYLADDIFYLPPKKSYTVTYRMYPVKGNYYDCLNILRKDLSLYQEIPALHGFVYKQKTSEFYGRYYRNALSNPDTVGKFFAESAITAPAFTSEPMLYGSERPEVWQQAWQIPGKFKKSLRMYDLPLKTISHYCDVHLVATDGVKDKNAESLWQERLADSILLNERNETVAYAAGRLYHVVPTLHNSAGRQIIENLQYLWNEHPQNGIFFDEFNHSRARIAWNFRDNCSALLDEKGNIKRKFAIVPLYCQDFLLAVSGMAIKHNPINFANQFDCTVKLMQQKLIHFAEPVAHEDSYLIRAAQASRTPLTLTCKRNTTAWEDVKYFLQYGVVVCYYASRMYGDHLLQKLYPLTVQAIYPGIVYGGDKILSNRSGKFTLSGAGKINVYIYSDPDGVLSRKLSINSNTVELKIDPAREVALIVADKID